jgi:hypothetical protein
MSEHYFIVKWEGGQSEAMQTYLAAKIMADEMVEDETDIQVLEYKTVGIKIYRPKQRENCWSCAAMVLHDAEGKCPECGEWDLPF